MQSKPIKNNNNNLSKFNHLKGVKRVAYLLKSQIKKNKQGAQRAQKLKRLMAKKKIQHIKHILGVKTNHQYVDKLNYLMEIDKQAKKLLSICKKPSLATLISLATKKKQAHQDQRLTQSGSTGSSSNINTIGYGYAPVDADQKDSDSSANTSNSTDSASASNTDTSNVTSPF